jgi:phosphoribosyl 1,2-cyclic phosphodiesterase
VRVYVCGARGSTPAPGADFARYGGHTCCLAVASGNRRAPDLILDAGTGLRQVTALLGESAFEGTLLLTHLHWDHIQGLPFFAGGDHEDSHVKVVLPDQGDGVAAERVLAGTMSPPFFPIEPTELRGRWEFTTASPGEWHSGAYSVLAREVPHKGGRTFGYRVSDGTATVAYVPDHCPTAFGDGPDGLGEYHEAVLELADGVDVLVHDAHLHGERELARESFLGHACAEYAAALGRRANAGTVVLFHHHPERTDEQLDELRRRLESTPEVRPATQGEVISVVR